MQRSRKQQELADDAIEVADLLANTADQPLSLDPILGFGGGSREQLETTQGVTNLVGYLGEHQTKLLVTFDEGPAHPFHGPRELADLEPRLGRYRVVHVAPLHTPGGAGEPLDGLDHAPR